MGARVREMRTAFLVLTSTAALVGATNAAAAPVDITPARFADHLSLRLAGPGGSSSLTWNGPETFAVVPHGTRAPIDAWVRNRGLETTAFAGGGSVVRRAFAADPDSYGAFDLIDPSLETLLAQARDGAITLTDGTVGTRATLRGTIALGPNDCAGYRAGTKTIDLDAPTLVPLRIITRRVGAPTQTIRMTGLRVRVSPAVLASRLNESNGLRANIRVNARLFTFAAACAHGVQASSGARRCPSCAVHFRTFG